jgi:hypothetical protein
MTLRGFSVLVIDCWGCVLRVACCVLHVAESGRIGETGVGESGLLQDLSPCCWLCCIENISWGTESYTVPYLLAACCLLLALCHGPSFVRLL